MQSITEKNNCVEVARLILDFLKTSIWPIVTLVFFLVYGDRVLSILSSREIDVFGVQIGQQINNFSHVHEQQISDLKRELLVRQPQLQEANIDWLTQELDKISVNVNSDLTAMRSQTTEPEKFDKIDQHNQAQIEEKRGFDALLNRDIDSAITAFDKARKLWPQYHNVDEIYRLLEQYKGKLNQKDQWKLFCEELTGKYSWGMPAGIKEELLRSI
ncbi:hypothetical protein [Sessilibacter sp. MAH4]